MDSLQQRPASSSPNSSEEMESPHGTPETKLSAFSPEDGQTQPKASEYGLVRSNLPPAFSLGHHHARSSPRARLQNLTLSASQDPFVTNLSLEASSRGPNDAPKLSPVASSFTPFKYQGHALTGTIPNNSKIAVQKSEAQTSTLYLGHTISMSSAVSPSINFGLEKHTSFVSSQFPASTVTRPNSVVPSIGDGNVEMDLIKIGQFSSEGETSRSLVISQIPRKTSVQDVDAFFSTDTFCSLKHLALAELSLNGTIFVNFTDIRDAHKAYAKVRSVHIEWSVQYIAGTKGGLKYQAESLNYTPLSMYGGQVVIKAEFTGPRQRFDAGTIGYLIKELLENYGELMGFEANTANELIGIYRAEFYDITAVGSALAYLSGFKIGGCTLTIMRFTPDVARSSLGCFKSNGPLIVGESDSTIVRSFGNLTLGSCRGIYNAEYLTSPLASPVFHPNSADRSLGYRSEFQSGQLIPSPEEHGQGFTPRSSSQSSPWSPGYSPYSDFGPHSPWAALNPGAVGQERGSPHYPQARSGQYVHQQRSSGKSAGRQSHDFSSGHHNVVDVERIRLGTDVRTTIMLRNIPNKIDQAMLKDIVDETSLGKYDFMYLRIDFANNCNVGYAFINFEDPIDIIDFVTARAGHRWNRYNSDKVAEVSYATIQGRDCLVQKFRNSSVMLEHPSFRPKIFHTGQGSLSGTEDKFPGPDNPSKMRRSVENAEHVGLFAPRAGQNFRDEQRRRRSQYDRGTRLAEMEDAYDLDYDHHNIKNDLNHLYPGSSYERPRGYPQSSYDGY